MKRFVLTFLLLLALPGVCFAAQSALSGDGYRQALSGYDLSAFEKLGDDANSVLEQLGLDDFDFETVTALDAKSCVQVLGRLVRQNIQTPLRALLSVLSFTLLSAFLTGFSGSGLLGQNSSVYSTASALVIAALIAAQCADTVSLCCATIGICADFVFAFFPAFLVILTVSGSSLTGVSTNTLLLGLALCFWLSWRGAKRLETVANGLDALAQGQTVRLPTDGFAGELAEKLNQTGAQLQAKNEMLSRRDNARTQWIAGVSHDVRTPLALILGWAEQLEQDALLPDSSRQKATGIRTQCEKLRTLIDDLNLTSKLEYGAQPLRRKDLRAGPLFRQLVAQFCESPLAERCEITLEQEEPAEQTVLSVDEALLARLLENLLNNSVRHNPKPVNITVHTRRVGERFCLTVADDGIGYPAAVLVALNAAEPAENAPHILGLYVVQQIAAAHGGTAVFGQNSPCGAKTTVWLPGRA